MNPVFRDGAAYVQHAWIMGVMTALFIVCFIGWTRWAYSKANRQKFEDAARLPLTTGEET
ncbi:MAG: CcoQ/FixQ family Cbb3-type cytochrome c oxidase assembly chaperone [Candidatus Cloacimonetes bacterium]|jgi:cbb3-type cytochrome oxidase subunit 3|nr:CcoQ/FixQ family Cbb3-type cytochrome c oxidase assembly chaperone [Candidatus Cloacimonadota bacterium]